MSVATWVHIYAPPKTATECELLDCPTCERPRRMLVECYEWHAANVTCAGCGERWSDGAMLERPFARGWRQESRNRAVRVLRWHGFLA